MLKSPQRSQPRRAIAIFTAVALLFSVMTGLFLIFANSLADASYTAEFFNNRSLTGSPVLVRNDAEINFEWGTSSPGTGVNADFFSARWSKTENFGEGTYKFSATADDGVRIYLNDEIILDKWFDQAPTTYEITKDLTAGEYNIKIEYYEHWVGAVMKFSYVQLDGTSDDPPDEEPAPEPETPPQPEPTDHYLGEYYNNRDLTGTPVLVRNDAEINFTWGSASPGPGVNQDKFSARWTKTSHFDAGTYEFTITADDGVRLYINDELILFKWFDQPPTTYTVTKTLSEGDYVVKMEYYENLVGAVAKLQVGTSVSTPPPPPPPPGETDPDAFSIIILPDTQKYVQFHPEIFTMQTEWIRDNYQNLNAKFVLHEGDIVETPSLLSEWDIANESMSILDGHIPYILALGNHDFPTNDARDTSKFNATFPVSRYQNEPWFGGVRSSGKLENAYYKFDIGDINFLVISLEFGPRDEVLDWANQIVAAHPDHKVIFLTHTYLYEDNTLHGSDPSHEFPPEFWMTNSNNGVEMWEKFVRKHPNMLFVFNGHINEVTGVGRLVSAGDAGNRVYQMLADYQDYSKGGNGWLRILTISPNDLTVSVKTYSPYLGAYLTDDSNQFVYTNVTELVEDFGAPDPGSGNEAPVVSAGPDQTITLPTNTVNLNGLITDDGLPEGGTVISMWSRMSGPGTVTFTDDSLASTEAVFSESGEYILRLTADDGEHVSYDEVKVTLNPVSSPSGFYSAEYFNNRSLTGIPVLVRNDAEINFTWGSASPSPGVNADFFSARWTRTVSLDEGVYEFSVTADDGVRVYINNVLVLDKWFDQPPTTYKISRSLAQGNHNIRMEYFEHWVGAVAKLGWVKL